MGNKPSLTKILDGKEEKFAGLFNHGNTCYLNGVIQALYACRPFRIAVLQYSKHPPQSEAKIDLLYSLARLFHEISSGKRDALSPKVFLRQLRKSNVIFDSTQHQDAHELLNFVLNHIAELLEQDSPRSSLSTSSSRASESKSRTWVRELFEGVLTNEIRCLRCETISRRDEKFLDLSVDIEQNSSITSCLRNFSHIEMLDQDSKYFCETCCSPQEAQRSMQIKELPNVLALHLKRFKYSEKYNNFKKLSYRVVFPKELKLFNTSNDAANPDRIYDLIATVIHVGSQPHRGHYMSAVHAHDEWLLFDDEHVEQVGEGGLQQFFGMTDIQQDYSKYYETAYILFYQARDFHLDSFVSTISDSLSAEVKVQVSKHKTKKKHSNVTSTSEATVST